MSQTSFPVNPELSALAIGYRNSDISLIGAKLMPIIPHAQKFTFNQYGLESGFTVPNLLVGRKSLPNEVEFQGAAVTAEVADYGLDDFVPNEDMNTWNAMPKAAGAYNPQQIATIFTTGLMDIGFEIRVSNIVQNLNSYLSTLRTTLSGTSQWNDYTNSNPVDAILKAMDLCIVRPNTMAIGRAAFTVLRQHPKVVAAVNPVSQVGSGRVSAQQLADLLELKEVQVGEGWVNTAKQGQTANLVRIWGKNCALINVSKDNAMTGQPTFGMTAQFGERFVNSIPDPRRGLTGGTTIRVGERRKELVISQQAGYYFQNCVA